MQLLPPFILSFLLISEPCKQILERQRVCFTESLASKRLPTTYFSSFFLTHMSSYSFYLSQQPVFLSCFPFLRTESFKPHPKLYLQLTSASTALLLSLPPPLSPSAPLSLYECSIFFVYTPYYLTGSTASFSNHHKQIQYKIAYVFAPQF